MRKIIFKKLTNKTFDLNIKLAFWTENLYFISQLFHICVIQVYFSSKDFKICQNWTTFLINWVQLNEVQIDSIVPKQLHIMVGCYIPNRTASFVAGSLSWSIKWFCLSLERSVYTSGEGSSLFLCSNKAIWTAGVWKLPDFTNVSIVCLSSLQDHYTS